MRGVFLTLLTIVPLTIFSQVQVSTFELDTLGKKVITDFIIEGNKFWFSTRTS